jgi:hypothetical protein
MRYYIERINTWGPANAKCAELHREMKKYAGCLVADDLSKDALVEEVRQTVERLNAAYPRTKKLVVRVMYGSVLCYPEQRTSDSDGVFSFSLAKVVREYRFAEGAGVLESGIITEWKGGEE